MPGEIKNYICLKTAFFFNMSGALGNKSSPQPLTVNVVH